MAPVMAPVRVRGLRPVRVRAMEPVQARERARRTAKGFQPPQAREPEFGVEDRVQRRERRLVPVTPRR
jgi:hypothetical protein